MRQSRSGPRERTGSETTEKSPPRRRNRADRAQHCAVAVVAVGRPRCRPPRGCRDRAAVASVPRNTQESTTCVWRNHTRWDRSATESKRTTGRASTLDSTYCGSSGFTQRSGITHTTCPSGQPPRHHCEAGRAAEHATHHPQADVLEWKVCSTGQDMSMSRLFRCRSFTRVTTVGMSCRGLLRSRSSYVCAGLSRTGWRGRGRAPAAHMPPIAHKHEHNDERGVCQKCPCEHALPYRECHPRRADLAWRRDPASSRPTASSDTWSRRAPGTGPGRRTAVRAPWLQQVLATHLTHSRTATL